MEYKMVKRVNVRYIAEVGMFIGIILLMELTGLNKIPIVPGLNMTLSMIPIAVGAMLLGPLAGTILGFVYGVTSLFNAITGQGGLTHAFFQYSWFLTIILCVVARTLVGLATGWLFRIFQRLDKKRIWCYFAGGLLAPMLNTISFMGFLVLFFYNTAEVQQKAADLGAKNVLMFIILFVGFNALIEWGAGLVVGGSVAKGVAAALKRYEPIPLFKEVKVPVEKPDETELPAKIEADETAEAQEEPEPTDEPKEK